MTTTLDILEKGALTILEELPEKEFQEFFSSLPYRVQLCCRGGLVDWREVLPHWYINRKEAP